MPVIPIPKLLLFDVFGTCVDWRSGVIREGAALARRRGLSRIDWPAFADAWRGQYQPRMDTVRSGQRPWVSLDVLHREALDDLLPAFGLGDLPERERAELNLAWHRLDPWPDVVPGLRRLKARCAIAPCSNGNIALLMDMAKRAGLPWDAVLGAEVALAYKPQPAAYLRSVEAAGVVPDEAMMVAAHNDDLVAAAACGLRTAFVSRPSEHGPGQTSDLAPAHPYDIVAADFLDLADRLGA